VYVKLTKDAHDKSIKIMRARAEIIVRALDQSGFENIVKKQMAVTKLGMIASEFKIDLSSDQASEYIEDAVNRVRAIMNPPVEQNDKIEG
ncbi:phage holin, LLH family, partial [Herbiconiux daphne]